MAKLSPSKAIQAKCFDCIYDPLSGGTRYDQTEACTSVECPLHEHRPLTKKSRDEIKRLRYEAMTPEQKAEFDERARIAGERFEEIRRRKEQQQDSRNG